MLHIPHKQPKSAFRWWWVTPNIPPFWTWNQISVSVPTKPDMPQWELKQETEYMTTCKVGVCVCYYSFVMVQQMLASLWTFRGWGLQLPVLPYDTTSCLVSMHLLSRWNGRYAAPSRELCTKNGPFWMYEGISKRWTYLCNGRLKEWGIFVWYLGIILTFRGYCRDQNLGWTLIWLCGRFLQPASQLDSASSYKAVIAKVKEENPSLFLAYHLPCWSE